MEPTPVIILFDGICELCSYSVQLIIKYDKRCQFKFAALQSAIGMQLLKEHGLGDLRTGSVVLLYRATAYTQSAAALKVAMLLGGPWKLCWVGYLVPACLRNGLYQWIARNRYRWFGKKTQCWMPTPELKQRFLDLD